MSRDDADDAAILFNQNGRAVVVSGVTSCAPASTSTMGSSLPLTSLTGEVQEMAMRTTFANTRFPLKIRLDVLPQGQGFE